MKRFHYFSLTTALFLLGFVLFLPLNTRAQAVRNTFAAGDFHSLSIHSDGTLWATGANNFGQLGTGNPTSQVTWVQVGTATNWVQVVAGALHSLGLRADGSLYAWGSNNFGQLGNTTNSGTGIANPTPTLVAGTYTQVIAGTYHSLALRADGSLWVWGNNQYGQLGNSTNAGSTTPNPTPTQVAGTYTQVAAGIHHTLGLQVDGSLWAWGGNQYGQLGNNSDTGTSNPTAHPTPTQVAGVYTQIACGDLHNLALRADGSLWLWGHNQYGQLGTTTTTGIFGANPTPLQLAGSYTQVAAGKYHSLALRADGALWAWGYNSSSQLGNTTNTGTTAANPTPTQVAGTYVRVVAGQVHTLALQANGVLYAWGSDVNHQLGIVGGTTFTVATPTATGTALPTRSTAVGSNFGLAIRGDGTLWAWGGNQAGQLGDGTTSDRARPAQVGTDNDWVQVATGQYHALALKATGQLYAWGNNDFGQLGQGTTSGLRTPTAVNLPGPVARLAAGGNHSLALSATGQLYTWGLNTYGQLGLGSVAATPTPAAVNGVFTQVAGGGIHSLALTATGSLYAWGSNLSGQLGNTAFIGTSNPNPTPALVAGLPPVVRLAAGLLHSLALAPTGTAYAWGYNASGQLGSATSMGTTIPTPTPQAITGLPLFTQLAAGTEHSLALTATGSLYTWGYNRQGQLGQGTTSAAVPTPAQEVTGNTWVTLGTGANGNFSLARTASAQTVASTGPNEQGELGDDTPTLATRFDRLISLASSQPLPVLAATSTTRGLLLAPNPAHSLVHVLGQPATATLSVYDALGRVVRTSTSANVDVAGLPAGVYVVRSSTPTTAPQATRLVVE